MVQIRAILFVKNQKIVLISKLAEELGISEAEATLFSEELVKHHWFRFVVHSQDSKALAVGLTNLARVKLKKVLIKKRQLLNQSMTHLTRREKEGMISIFNKILNHFN
jgi:DNA-binding MarR family transcriptional regulator